MDTPEATLTAAQLDIRVPGRSLVEKLDVECRHGEVLAVLGRNGSGKSLTLHALAGLAPIAGGAVSLRGQPINGVPRRAIARDIALLPQDAEDVFPSSVFETVLIGRHPHVAALRLESAEDRDIARRCLAEVGLDGMAERNVETLSGGERRRLAIAQTLAQAPGTFLLDEPLNHLDPQHQLDVLDLFADRARNGAAVVITLHDANLAARYADRALLLFGDGRWRLGSTESVLTEAELTDLFRVRMESLPWRNGKQFVATGTRGNPES